MVRTNVSVEAILGESIQDGIHIQGTAGRKVCTLFEAVLENRNVTGMDKMDSAHSGRLCCHVDNIILCAAAERTGSVCETVVRIIHEL